MTDVSDIKGVLVGIGVLLALRLIDYFLPKGYHFKKLSRYADRTPEWEDDDEPK